MQEQVLGRLKALGSTVGGFTAAQKVLVALGVALLALGGTAFARWVATPTMEPLFSDLASEDASAIVEQLEGEGVPYELTDGGGTVLVPREHVYPQRLAASAAGLPGSDDTGYSLLDEQGVTSSQFQQQVTYQRALEGELAKTIGALGGVETAVVHLAIPTEDVFLDETSEPTASVLLQLDDGTGLPAEQVQSVVHLVASSVEGMAPEDVTVVDGDGTLLSAAGEGAMASGGVREQETGEYEARTTAAVQAMLEKVLGAGNAVATVSAELDYDATQRTSETFSAEPGVPPLSESIETETYTGGGAAVGGALGDNGVLGMDGATVGDAAAGTGRDYRSESITRNNAVNKVTEQTQTAPGSVRRQSVAVVVDTEAAAAVGVAELTEMVGTAAGVDVARGDTVSVTQAPFDTSAADAAKAELEAAAAAEADAARNALVRDAAIAGVLLLLALVALVVHRRRKKQRQVLDLGHLDIVRDGDDALALPDGEATAALPAAEPTVDENVQRRIEVSELVDAQPDDVAELLRGWLQESRS